VTDPTTPRSRGRHSQPDAGGNAGRPASELLATWAIGAGTLQLADDGDPVRSRRRRRYAPDTDAGGAQGLPARGGVDVAEVEITGLDATGIADVGLAAAGLDLSAFGIERPEPRRGAGPLPTPPAWPWAEGTTGARVDPAPRTTEMPGVLPVLPHLGEDDRRGPAADRRSTPAPRPAADRVAADRFADADTDPGWVSATNRPVPPPASAPSLGSLVTDVPAPRQSGPVSELATEVHPAVATGATWHEDEYDDEDWPPLSSRHRGEPDDGDPGDHPQDPTGPASAADHTGGLEMIVTDDEPDLDDVEDRAGGGRGGRGGRGRGSGGGRRRRGPVTIVLSLVVLAALVVGIVVGGQTLYRTINPIAEDYSGTGTGTVDVRVDEGNSLRAIAGTLVAAGVIASAGPFEDAADANPAATGIQPGVYRLHQHMSGQSALDLLMDPASRQVTKVTVPEGLTATEVLQRLADQAGLPLDQLQAAAADPASLGLPAYADGMLEGFLFPATYDIEPGDTATQVLSQMVAGTVRVLDELGIPEDQRLGVVTEASIVQAEAGSVEDMGKVARVLDNRIADGMPLQLDTTVNYANGKGGLTTTAADRANPSPYNTYMHPGLPPGAIGNPGEEALRAVLNPTPGDWRFFVVVNPDTGETRFAVTAAEHNQNVLLFQQWLQDHPGN
jgi:UPF0755 protein